MHEEQHWTLTEISVPWEVNQHMALNTSCSPDYRYHHWTGARQGGTIHRGRCASQFSPVDKHGWRNPTPYWGYEWRELVYSPNAVLCRFKLTATHTQIMESSYPAGASFSLPGEIVPGKTLAEYRPYFGYLQATAVTDCLARLGEATAELSVELREARKTADFLEDKLRWLWRDVRDVYHRRIPKRWKRGFKRLRKDPIRWARKEFPDRWMELRYGWNPTIRGIQDIITLLDNQVKGQPFLMTARRRVEEEEIDSQVSHWNWNFGPYLPVPIDVHIKDREKRSVYCVLTMTPKSELVTQLNSAGIINLPSASYETLPFSWMLDWAVGVGKYLNAYAAATTMNLKGGTATHVHIIGRETTVEKSSSTTYHWCIPFATDVVTAGGTMFNRVVLSGVDISPTLPVGSGINLVRSLDSISLLTAAFSGWELISGPKFNRGGRDSKRWKRWKNDKASEGLRF